MSLTGAVPGLAPDPRSTNAPLPELSSGALACPHHALPRMWIGFVIAALCLWAQVSGKTTSDGTAGAFLVALLGHAYWVFCVYRIHKVLKEATRSQYRISPFKAAALLFIPLFQYYWTYKWPKEVAKFINSRSPVVRMRENLPGLWLAFGVLLVGFVPYFATLHLVLIFAVGTYLNKWLRKPFAFALHVPSRASGIHGAEPNALGRMNHTQRQAVRE